MDSSLSEPLCKHMYVHTYTVNWLLMHKIYYNNIFSYCISGTQPYQSVYNVSSFEQSTSPFSANSSEVVAVVLAVNDPPQVDLTTSGELPQTHKDHVECSMYSIRSNFHVVKLL